MLRSTLQLAHAGPLSGAGHWFCDNEFLARKLGCLCDNELLARKLGRGEIFEPAETRMRAFKETGRRWPVGPRA